MVNNLEEQIKKGKELIDKLRDTGRDSKSLEARVQMLEMKFKERQRAKVEQKPDAIPDIEKILGMRLSELSRRNIAIKIYSEVLGCEIWLCGNEQMASQVKQDDPEAVTYTVDELRELITLNPSLEDIKRIHNAKSVFKGSSRIVEYTSAPESLREEDKA